MSDKPNKLEVAGLVLASQKGEADAFGRIYDYFIDGIYRYIYFRVGEEEAEDLTELVFLKAWENIRQYKATAHGFSAWIYRIAHNLIVDFYRLNKHKAEELTENFIDTRPEVQTQDRAHRSLTNTIVVETLKSLPGDYRQILILKFVEELEYEEIAEVMSRTQPALRILQFRALRKLKKLLADRGITEF